LPGLAVEASGGTCWLVSTALVMLLHKLPARRSRTCWPCAASADKATSVTTARAQVRSGFRCMARCSFC
jgi:hypothetical protein